jgi:hypothetical protein
MGKQVDSPRIPSPARGGEPAGLGSGGSYGEYDENGVDLSLLRYLLSLSPLERLRLMERHARDTQVLNDYGRQYREISPYPDR